MHLSEMLPTGTPPSITGSWEYPVLLMSSEASWTCLSLDIETTSADATSAAFMSLGLPAFMASSVSNSLTMVS